MEFTLDQEKIEKLWLTGSEVLNDEPMSSHVSFRIGGPVKYFIIPNSLEAFVEALKITEGFERRIIGNGTNILPADEKKDLIVISSSRTDYIKFDGKKVDVAAGTPLKKLCLEALKMGLSGLENGYGIPGSVGGAVYINAGAYCWETFDNLVSVTFYENGEIKTLKKDEIDFGYRYSTFKNDRNKIILSAVFELSYDDKEKIRERMLDVMKKRYEKQPLDMPSAGSVFKRPKPDFYVGTTIEKLGLKGFKIGDAKISEKHGGFIVNDGNAKAEDVLKLIEFIKEKVYKEYNVQLETEVEIWR